MSSPRPSYARAKAGGGYVPVDMPVTRGLIAGGTERLRNVGKRKSLPKDNRYHNLSVLQDTLGGASQIATAPIMGLLAPALESAADSYKAYRALPRQRSVDADAMDAAASAGYGGFSPGMSRASTGGQGLLDGGLNPLLDDVEYVGKRLMKGIDNTADDIGYDRDLFRELVGTGAGFAAAPAAKGLLGAAGEVGGAIEAGANKAGYTFRQPDAQSNSFFAPIRVRKAPGVRANNPRMKDPLTGTSKPALEIADDMRNKGASPEEVYYTTGILYEPKTGMPMTEHSDAEAKLKVSPEEMTRMAMQAPRALGMSAHLLGRVDDFWENDALFDMFPALRNSPLFMQLGSKNAGNAAMSPPGALQNQPFWQTIGPKGRVNAAFSRDPNAPQPMLSRLKDAGIVSPGIMSARDMTPGTRYPAAMTLLGNVQSDGFRTPSPGKIIDTVDLQPWNTASLDYRRGPGSPDADWMFEDMASADWLNSLLKHEVGAHGVQASKKGFPMGANYNTIYKKLRQQGYGQVEAREMAWAAYQRSPGEVLARLGPRRGDLTDSQLRNYYPFHDNPDHPLHHLTPASVASDNSWRQGHHETDADVLARYPNSPLPYQSDVPNSQIGDVRPSKGYWSSKDGFPRGSIDFSQSVTRDGGTPGLRGFSSTGLMGLSSIDLPPGSDVRYRGDAPNRTTEYPRYVPRNLPATMQRLMAAIEDPNSSIHGMFDQYINRGKQLGGDDWYNTEELRDWFIDVADGDEVRGDAMWREFLQLVGNTSTGSKVPQNIRNASFYHMLQPDQMRAVAERVAQGGITPADAARELGIDVPNMPDNYRYGHKQQANHAKNVLNSLAGEWSQTPPTGLTRGQLSDWLKANPKVKGFFNDLVGSQRNIAADMHFMRLLAMFDGGLDFLSSKAGLSAANLERLRATYGDAIEPYVKTRETRTGDTVTEVNLFKAAKDGVITDTSGFRDVPTAWKDAPDDTEYAALEELANRMAARYGMSPKQFQANLWMGAGDLTGLADESQGTFMELFRRALDNRAEERGVDRRTMFRDFALKRAPLSVAGGVGIGGGLLAAQPQGDDDLRRQMMRGY